jgi:WD40 repeat protein
MKIDPAKSKPAREFKHEAPLMTCAFDAAGRFLFAGGRDRGILAIDLPSGRRTVLAGHDSWVASIVRAGESVLSADYAGRVIAWDSSGKSPVPRYSIEAHPSTIYGLSVAADGRIFATGDRDGCVRIRRTADGKLLRELPRFEFPVYGVAIYPDGERIVTADRRPRKPTIKVWAIASAEEQLSIEVAELSGYRRVEDIEWGGIRALALSPDGSQIVACGRNGYDGQACAMVYDAGDGKLRHKLAQALKGGFYYSAKYHPQGFLLTAGGDIAKGEFRSWDLNQGTSISFVATAGPCHGLDIHPDGMRLAVAQAVGKGSTPESGLLSVHEWSV